MMNLQAPNTHYGEVRDRLNMRRRYDCEPGMPDLCVEVDLYGPQPGRPWDVDAWESAMVRLYGAPQRAVWRQIYRIARILLGGKWRDGHESDRTGG